MLGFFKICKYTFFNIWKRVLAKKFSKPFLSWKSINQFFWLPFFWKINKSILTNLKRTWDNFFTCPPFQILKKVYWQILKKSSAIFCLVLFSNLKKSRVSSLKKSEINLFACPLFQILKKVNLQILKKPSTIFLLVCFLKC